MRESEQNLDVFWEKVGEMTAGYEPKKQEYNTHVFVCDLVSQDRALQRTPVWVEPTREDAPAKIQELYIPFSQLNFGDQKCQQQSSHDYLNQQPKKKIKTRGAVALGTPTAAAEPDLQPAAIEPRPQFSVNARALKAFKTIFFTPSVSATPGEVPWTDFLHAMVSVGFIPEKLYGSVWQFSPDPDKLLVKRSIQFRQPHGANTKITYKIARRFGRRLNRAYGWDGSSFTLMEKEKQ